MKSNHKQFLFLDRSIWFAPQPDNRAVTKEDTFPAVYPKLSNISHFITPKKKSDQLGKMPYWQLYKVIGRKIKPMCLFFEYFMQMCWCICTCWWKNKCKKMEVPTNEYVELLKATYCNLCSESSLLTMKSPSWMYWEEMQ